jgi:hypothetical protein
MHERKKGTLKSGRSGKKVKSRKQAIAIGLSQARKEGGKVPGKEKVISSGSGQTRNSVTIYKDPGFDPFMNREVPFFLMLMDD